MQVLSVLLPAKLSYCDFLNALAFTFAEIRKFNLSNLQLSQYMEQSIQDRFFQKIKQILPANYALADELADVLNLSKDSVYRRLRGETSLSLEEVLTICQHYKITFESIANPNAVTFEFKEINPDVESFHQYLIRLLGDLKRIKSLENSEILYAAEDIPVFHHFKMWGRGWLNGDPI